ncbi:MAG: GntR family transcriptional regulator [Spirochaetia bacterium]|nr:GntR family transcriptional regulator [Spirochaetia bacterium]MCF7941606.1 GntR family transcriptional regulator [Spirochaetia bacterium]
MAKRTYNLASKGSNISETVYSVLHKNIVNLNLVPGTLISEKEIADKLQVSRTPVREAFIRLSREALVSIFPQKGTFVSKIDLSRVQEERFLRESLEAAVVEQFLQFHTEEGIDRLYRNIEKQKEALKSGQLSKFIDYDDQFHAIMFDETKKHMCYDVLVSFSSHYRRIRYLSMYISTVPDNNVEQHRKLLEAIEKRDSAEASSILRRHIRKLIIEKDEICDRYPDYFQSEERFIGDDAGLFDAGSDFLKLMGKQPFEA